MRNLKIEAGPVELGYRAPSTSTGSGGAITWSVHSIDMNQYGAGSIGSFLWTSRVDMNLIRFEMSGIWTYITETNPVYVHLVRNNNGWDVLAEIVLTVSSGTYEFWTGSVPINAGDLISCYIYGSEVYVPDFYTYPQAEDLCVTGWFDGESGGGLILYPNMGE